MSPRNQRSVKEFAMNFTMLRETVVSANSMFWRGASYLKTDSLRSEKSHLGGLHPYFVGRRKVKKVFLPPHGLAKSIPLLDIQSSEEGPDKSV